MRRPSPAMSDALLSAVVLALSLALAATSGHDQPGTRPVDGLAYAVTGTCCALLAARRRWPLAVTAAAGVGLAAFALRGYPGGALILPVTIALYTAGTAIERSRALPIGAAATAIVVLRALSTSAARPSAFTWAASGWVMAALVWGVAVRARRQTIQALRDRAEAAERTRDQEAARRVAEERLRIARDLHDVVGHSFATVNVQARVAATVLDGAPDRAREALAAIETTSRDALGEIRQALSVLRSTAPQTAPAATADLERLEGLPAPLRAAGVTVEVTVDLGGHRVPVVLRTSVYRIVQEALTNVLKHARARRVQVRITCDGKRLTAEVTDDGVAGGASAPRREGHGPGGPGPEDGHGLEGPEGHGPDGPSLEARGGHGLEGMAERAAALGGRLEAGPRPGGGFAVTASIPMAG